MKSIADQKNREGLISRINALSEGDTAVWGAMSVQQMVQHCILVEEMYLGKKQYKQVFLGKLLGKIALREMLGKDKPMRHSAPTMPEFKNPEVSTDLESLKQQWVGLIQEYENSAVKEIVHPFFGKVSREQIGFIGYKHADHHLKQFGS
ncbi:MAG: DUF1569 domain-containing protein [Patescibacteria group bacterium]